VGMTSGLDNGRIFAAGNVRDVSSGRRPFCRNTRYCPLLLFGSRGIQLTMKKRDALVPPLVHQSLTKIVGWWRISTPWQIDHSISRQTCFECCQGDKNSMLPHVDPYTPENTGLTGRSHSMKKIVFLHIPKTAGAICAL